jgi:hypothetical protein
LQQSIPSIKASHIIGIGREWQETNIFTAPSEMLEGRTLRTGAARRAPR